MTSTPGWDAPDGAATGSQPPPLSAPFATPHELQPPPSGYGAPPGYGPPPGFGAAPYGKPLDSHDLASPWLRLGEALLNGLLMLVTLGIGYLVWTMVLWSDGTNPGKKMLGMKIVSTKTGQTLTWGEMFVRNFVFGGVVLGVLNVVTLSIVSLVDALMVFGQDRQRLIDKMASSAVVMR